MEETWEQQDRRDRLGGSRGKDQEGRIRKDELKSKDLNLH